MSQPISVQDSAQVVCGGAARQVMLEDILARGNTAVKNGVVFSRDSKVIDITKDENGIFHIKTKKEEFLSKTVINAAGLYADEIYKMVLKDKKDDAFDITPVRGEYYLLDKEEGDFVSHVIFQTPTSLGKGVLVSPTADGNLIVGPDANENIEGKDDLGNTNDALAYIRNRSARSVPNVNFRNNIRNFAGNRATIKGREDFLIEESKIVKGFINFAGIKSPGLTSGNHTLACAGSTINHVDSCYLTLSLQNHHT